jgi:hypothetical protein
MQTKRNIKIDAAAAEQCGKMAFARGDQRIPALDATYCNEILTPNIKGKKFGETSASTVLGLAWLRGWDRAMLDAPVEFT